MIGYNCQIGTLHNSAISIKELLPVISKPVIKHGEVLGDFFEKMMKWLISYFENLFKAKLDYFKIIIFNY